LLFRKFLISFSLAILTGCGFQPIYSAGTNSVFEIEMRDIEILPIENRIGQQLRNQLEQRITPKGRSRFSKYILKVTLSEGKQDLAVKKSEIATRSNLNFRANYSVTDKLSKKTLTSGSSRMVTSYNILTETFATLMAEKDARKRAVREISADITSKIAAFFKLDRDRPKKVK
jgi:LPS-assembly lipoprotein